MAGSIAASIAGSVISGGLGMLSSNKQASAASKAQDANANYLNRALDIQGEQFNYLKSIQKPYVDFGTSALGAYAGQLGFTPNEAASGPDPRFAPVDPRDVPSSGNNFFGYGSLEAAHAAGVRTGADYQGAAGGSGRPTSYTYDPANDRSRLPEFEAGAEFTNPLTVTQADLTSDPSYQFRRDEAQNALNSRARATGMSLSGNALEDLAKLTSNLASTEFGNIYARKAADRTQRYGVALDEYNSRIGSQQNQMNRLASAAGVGQQAVNNIGAAGQNYANAASNILAQTGQGAANSQLVQGAAGVNALNGIGQNLGYGLGGGYGGSMNWLNQSPGWPGGNSFNGTGTAFAPVNWLN